jgi:hypothetical protein
MVQVQPDMEELTENAEDGADEAESKQSEVKLGRLQYKVRHLYMSFLFCIIKKRNIFGKDKQWRKKRK